MMHHDCVETPTPAQMGEGGKKKGGGAGSGSNGERAIVNEQLHRAFLEKHPYQQFSEEEVAQAKELLQREKLQEQLLAESAEMKTNFK